MSKISYFYTMIYLTVIFTSQVYAEEYVDECKKYGSERSCLFNDCCWVEVEMNAGT